MQTEFNIELDDTKVHISCTSHGCADEDTLGDSSFSFEVADLERIEWAELGMDNFDSLRAALLEGRDEDEIADIMADGTVHCSNTDTCILALNYLIAGEKEFSIGWESDGSAFWLFHDITHALEDAGGGSIYVEAYAEDRANREGAVRALAAGMPLAEILEELGKTVAPFIERFSSMAPSALEDFIADCGSTHDHEAFIREAAELIETEDEDEEAIQEQVWSVVGNLLERSSTLWAHVCICSPNMDALCIDSEEGGMQAAATYALEADITQALAA